VGSGVARLSSFGGFGLSRSATVLREHGSRERPSANGEAVSVGGFDDEAGGGHGGEALVEGGGANAAGCPQFGERLRLLAFREGCGDALIDRSRLEVGFGMAIELDLLECKGVVTLGEFKCDTLHGGGGAMLDGQDNAIVAVAAEIEVGTEGHGLLRITATSGRHRQFVARGGRAPKLLAICYLIDFSPAMTPDAGLYPAVHRRW
jgi:hypothetical protein